MTTDTTSRHTFPRDITTAVATTLKWSDMFPGENVAAEMTNGANGEIHFGLTGRVPLLDLDTRDAEFAAATERALSHVPPQLRDDRISPAQLAVFTIGHGAWLTGKATAARAMDDADAALRGAMTAVVRGVAGDSWERVLGQWQRHTEP